MRQIKTASDAWSTWDKQMRANHGVEDKETERPMIDINVMAALPSLKEVQARTREYRAQQAREEWSV